MDKMLARLKNMAERYDEINDTLINTPSFADAREYARLSKEQSSLQAPVEAYRQLLDVMQQIEDARELLKDHELHEMAEMELAELQPREQELLDRLEVLLIEKDPNDECNAIFEIRGAAGGDEGNIFAGDLYRMYVRYAESKGWKIETYYAEECEAGGFSNISFIIKGKEVYREMKFESGAHRVQRVPKTESAGRIHTSTATVLVLPEVDNVDYQINEEDLIFETHRASGAGGQHINKTDSAVRITHIPTGITVNCQDGRSQIQNREQALKIITARVFDEYKRKEEAEKGEVRRSKIGTGDRSEKIRTYNYPQNRVTDHRINFTVQQLDRVMEGKLDDIINALLEADQKARIAGESM
ncbi:MAG: peptide chain release factor 1 [Erysipelotrichaceae bacterium]|nr:peptide chain release factor 1 [Erysipelotrichaceae bacterium]MBO4538281.1 peptide chain release factor 1 [Erysipelotrichaceae bacterium]MBR5049638.1 peptide chain release factor 1 [Erysipelotrichaceae bacterium]